MELYFRPLDNWPRDLTPAEHRKHKPFRTGLEESLRLLRYELQSLKATAAVVQTAHAEADFSVTLNRPRGDRVPRHPGVIVAADTKHGALKWVCDDCRAWTDNVHAIMLTLERLRLADLYGVTKRGEQYKGWKMLPGPITLSGVEGQAGMSIEQAARFVAALLAAEAKRLVVINPYGSAQELIASRKAWEKARRAAAKMLHPDAGGSGGEWDKFQQAATLLDELHNR